MKLSNYTITVENYPAQGEQLLFSTRTQALVKINQELRDVIDHYHHPQKFTLKIRYRHELIQLHQMGILVASQHEDKEKITNFFNQLKYSIKKSCLKVTILTTDACNFDCVYCFEKSAKENVAMDLATCDLTMDWIKRQMEHMDYEKLSITFYGGEPLLNTSSLIYIVSGMKNWCRDQGKTFQFILQTNGYLMAPACIDQYLVLGLDHVRISLDGLKDVHDRNRPLKGGGGTFDKIMYNIMACIDKVAIGISTSYDRDNIAHVEDLLNYFEDLGILDKLGDFVFSPIHPSFGPKSHPDLFRQMSCMSNYDDEVLITAMKKIRDLMKRKNLPLRSPLAISACPLTRENGSVVIDQQGRIYKCNSMIGYPEFTVGHVHDETYKGRQQEFLHLDVWKKCPCDCPYLPMCGGGCRFMAFLEKKSFALPTCKRRFLDEMTPEFIKEEYDNMTNKNP